MEFKKNDLLTVTIEDMGHDGEGIGKCDGYTVFVKDAVIGDVVRARAMKMKKNYGFARLMEVLVPSADRVVPPCPLARPCGGCQLQAMSFAIDELGLYLDTHRDDADAVALFNQYVERYADAMQKYEAQYGSLTQRDSALEGTYTWIDDPWPWDYLGKEPR